MKFLAAVLLIGCVALAGCVSPEATRTRGGGLGGDIGNRPRLVRMHGGSDPYFETPERISVEHVPLAGAQQAQRADVGHGQ